MKQCERIHELSLAWSRPMRDISDAASPAATIARLPARSLPVALALPALILPPEPLSSAVDLARARAVGLGGRPARRTPAQADTVQVGGVACAVSRPGSSARSLFFPPLRTPVGTHAVCSTWTTQEPPDTRYFSLTLCDYSSSCLRPPSPGGTWSAGQSMATLPIVTGPLARGTTLDAVSWAPQVP